MNNAGEFPAQREPAIAPPPADGPVLDPGDLPAGRPDPHRLLAIVFGVVIAIAAITAIALNLRRPEGNKDYPKWYAACQSMLHGGDLYSTGDGNTFMFMYPPSAAAMLAPLSVAGFHAMAVALILINSASWVFCALAAVYLVTGRALRQAPLLYIVPVAATLTYVWSTYILGQSNLFLLACMMGAFVCLRQGRQWSAGGLVAVAAGIKAFPVAAIVYLVYRRYWKAVAGMVLGLAFLLLVLPVPFRGVSQNLQDVRKWAGGMIFQYDAGAIGQRAGRGYGWKNQSLIAVTHRLFRHVDADDGKDNVNPRTGVLKVRQMYVNVADLSFRGATVVILLFAGALGLIYIWAMPPQARRTPWTDAVEWAMLLLLILVLSPYSFGYFDVWLLYPFAMMTALCLRAPAASRERNVLVSASAVCIALLALTLSISLFFWAQAVGNVMWAILLIFGVFVWELRRDRTAISAVAPPVHAMANPVPSPAHSTGRATG